MLTVDMPGASWVLLGCFIYLFIFNSLPFLCPLCYRVTRLQEELVSLRLQCSSVYRKGHFLSGGMMGEQTQRLSSGSLAALGAQTLMGAAGVMTNLLRRPMSRSELVAVSSSEDEGSLRFIYELLGWVEATQVCLYCVLIRQK